jgi:hypothetical protein
MMEEDSAFRLMEMGFLCGPGIVFNGNGIPSLIKSFYDLVRLILKQGNHYFQRFRYILFMLSHAGQGQATALPTTTAANYEEMA